jgi:site-specific recombinase XerC
MDREKSGVIGNPDEQLLLENQLLPTAPVLAESPTNQNASCRFWHEGAHSHGEAQVTIKTGRTIEPRHEFRVDVDGHSMTVGEFVQIRFIPEYVAARGTAGRAHFQTILRYILTPEQVACAFPGKRHKTKVGKIPGWPYLGLLQLCDASADTIQHLTSTALQFGYSIQTATHIRSVVRAIFSHAIATNNYSSDNPAALVTLPRMARKEPHSLTVTQLKELIPVMRYPEKHIALFATLTDLNLSEICGLQWKYVNLSTDNSLVDGEWIPSRSIAVRRQSYRGQHGVVTAVRQRFVPAPELLCSILNEIRTRRQFTGPDDFVFVSRKGTLIYPENIAARRLKPIGKTLEMPWLSWNVFHRTYATLGRTLQKELRSIYYSPSL